MVLSALAAGSLLDSGTMALLFLLLGRDMGTAVIGCAHGPAIIHLLIITFFPSDFYVYL